MVYSFLFFLITVVIIEFVITSTRQKLSEAYLQLQSLASIYVSVHMADLEKDTFAEVMCNVGEVRELVGEAMIGASKRILHVMDNLTEESQKQSMFEFVNFKTLQDRLSELNSITKEFIDNKDKWHRGRFICMKRNASGQCTQVLWLVEAIDEEKRQREKLLHLSEMDSLTKINNRRSAEEKICQLLNKNNSGMLCLIDLDLFKQINDTLGHDAGDEVLVSFAECLKNVCREDDVVGRFGGDEFIIFVPDIQSKETALRMIYRLFDSINKLEIEKRIGRVFSVSAGITLASNDISYEELFKQADSCMYRGKNVKENTAHFYGEDESV